MSLVEKLEHTHVWNEVARIALALGVDSYSVCPCGHVLHVYTYAPGNIRHETIAAPDTWTAGYAYGLARGLRGDFTAPAAPVNWGGFSRGVAAVQPELTNWAKVGEWFLPPDAGVPIANARTACAAPVAGGAVFTHELGGPAAVAPIGPGETIRIVGNPCTKCGSATPATCDPYCGVPAK